MSSVFLHLGYLLIAFALSFLTDDCYCLRGVRLEIRPPAVHKGRSVTLLCLYDLENAPLYAVKWYRGTYEFYRYNPSEMPANKVFPYPGINVDSGLSNSSQVVLREVGFGLSGNFSCEVTTDAPSFSTAVDFKHMSVIGLPLGLPILHVEGDRYAPGEDLRANCTSQPSRPAAVLSFSINGMPVDSSLGRERESINDDGLLWSHADLHVQLMPAHFAERRLVISCTAHIATFYRETTSLQLGTKMGEPVHQRAACVNCHRRAKRSGCDIIAEHLIGCNSRNPGQIFVSIIFIVCEVKQGNFPIPVFKIRKCVNSSREECRIFIDDVGRIYSSWKNYLEENKLPKCKMIVPKNGKYCGRVVNFDTKETEVLLETLDSPSNTTTAAVIGVADATSTVASLGTTCLLGATLVSSVAVAPAVLAGAAVTGGVVGVYSLFRGTSTLRDRTSHGQDLSLKDPEVRDGWLNIAGGLTGILTSGVTKLMSSVSNVAQGAASLATLTKLKTACDVASTTNLFLNMGWHNKNHMQKMFIFNTSFLFFNNAVISMEDESTNTNDIRLSLLELYDNVLKINRPRELFLKAQIEEFLVDSEQSQQSSAQIIEGIKEITDWEDLTNYVSFISKLLKEREFYTLNNDNIFVINDEIILDKSDLLFEDDLHNSILHDRLVQIKKSLTIDEMSSIQQFIVCHLFDISNIDFEGLDRFFSKESTCTMAFFMTQFTDDVKEILIQVLAHFSQACIQYSYQITRLYPLNDVIVVIFQFLINYVTIKSINMVEKYNEDIAKTRNDIARHSDTEDSNKSDGETNISEDEILKHTITFENKNNGKTDAENFIRSENKSPDYEIEENVIFFKKLLVDIKLNEQSAFDDIVNYFDRWVAHKSGDTIDNQIYENRTYEKCDKCLGHFWKQK